MQYNEINDLIDVCQKEISNSNNKFHFIYEICFLKIYAKFEQYIGDIFIDYVTGKASPTGYKPIRKLQFEDESHLKAILNLKDTDYIDYFNTIKRLSKHIFELPDPFGIILEEANNQTYLSRMIALRNHIAHNSLQSKQKYISECLYNKTYILPSEHLIKIEKKQNKSNYTIYINIIKTICENILNEPII